ncbi:DUF1905 domain-containing protein [Sphingomonas jeddahensis]|uniref:DUF1905 domain-containing protein n=1 Tax=Sphingomonas jeddahensis TaxID=1915074 RepID=A0A1V2ER34_9SPHN|nr:DUF1905 domain-containing protein [Sphingomonas jeddahensis]ONF95136.1 hypothetical protein SPHI_26750 [Sphingomonas jeddahensis]
MDGEAPLLDVTFAGAVIEWRGPAPFFFVALPEEEVVGVRAAARVASYGWGVVPVTATIGDTVFATSLFPRDGGYLLPLKDAVRRAAGVTLGNEVVVRMRIEARERPLR